MDREIYIGDRVETEHGIGIVLDARSWREVILDMDDNEAKKFSEKCEKDMGINFFEWVELLVMLNNGERYRLLGKDVKVLEGR